MAQGFDEPGAGPVRSLAHAVERSEAFTLGGFFDVDLSRTEMAESRWSCPVSPRERGAWLATGWDVIFIATPDDRHADDLGDALAVQPRAILVEKPTALDADHGRALLERAMHLGIPVMVDYPRRWHSGVADVAALMADGTLGEPQRAVFAYTGGAMHSGVHMIDLLHTWIGAGWRVTASSGAGAMVRLAKDRTEIEIAFVRAPSETYYLWEVHLYFERGKVELSRSPEMLAVFRVKTHPTYLTHHVLAQHAHYEMESEPLLERTLNELQRAIADPEFARRHAQREIESQSLVSAILRGMP